jgi:hypothetical protein
VVGEDRACRLVRAELQRDKLPGLIAERRKPQRMPPGRAQGVPPQLVLRNGLAQRIERRVREQRSVVAVHDVLPAVVPGIQRDELGGEVVRPKTLGEVVDLVGRQSRTKALVEVGLMRPNPVVELVEHWLEIVDR